MNDEKLEELFNRTGKMSYLLGMATGGMFHLLSDDRIANCQKEPLSRLLTELYKGIDELYYKDGETNDQTK